MSLEALWAVMFGTGNRLGVGFLGFETERIFGGDTSFYYPYNPSTHPLGRAPMTCGLWA